MNKTIPESHVVSVKSPAIVLLLCILLGNFGIHRFYVGKIVSGILMLLTFGGLGVWYLIDLAMLISNKFTDNEGNPLELMKNPPRFKKIITLFSIIIILFYSFLLTVIAQIMWTSNRMITVAENQLIALKSGDIDKAYAYTSPHFQHKTTLKDFKEFVEKYQLETNEPRSFLDSEIAISADEVSGNLKLNNGTLFLIKYHLIKKNKEWKIQSIELKPIVLNERKKE